jgi:phosphoserine aminotransferase
MMHRVRNSLVRSFSTGRTMPHIRPDPRFSSGPCKKHPGWRIEDLPVDTTGRSHRGTLCSARLKEAVDRTIDLLQIPADYRVAIVAASDTGAMEMAMWNLLGSRPVDGCYWESFGLDWFKDMKKELKLDNVVEHSADYGHLPDLSKTNPDHDIVFTLNGTTSGVRVPDLDWISSQRQGLTLCDATSGIMSMELDWSKLDVTTFSWQKVMGGEGAHGMIVLSPRVFERLKTHPPIRALPKIFRIDANSESKFYEGQTINTPSMVCVEDYLGALRWAEGIGGLPELIARSKRNFDAIDDFVKERDWINFLAVRPETRSTTSVCLTLNGIVNGKPVDPKVIQKLLEKEGVAFDIGAYKNAPPGLRIWCGATVESGDVKALTEWLDWATK